MENCNVISMTVASIMAGLIELNKIHGKKVAVIITGGNNLETLRKGINHGCI